MTDTRSSSLMPRALLAEFFGRNPRLLRAFETQALVVEDSAQALQGNVAATEQLQDASVVTLSPNASLTNEYLLTQGDGVAIVVLPGIVRIEVDATVARARDYAPTFVPPGPGVVNYLPAEGTLVSDTVGAVLYNKSLSAPLMADLVNAATDAAAAAAGVAVGGIYHNAGALRIRLA